MNGSAADTVIENSGSFHGPNFGLPEPSTSTSRQVNNTSHTVESRVALITGAAQGIGRGIALRLALNGYRVAICDLPGQAGKLQEVEREISSNSSPRVRVQNGEEEAKQNGVGTVRRVQIIIGDVSKEEDVKAMVEKCVEVLGGLDVMVANAGIAIYKPLLELPVEDFDRVIAVNLRGAMLCYKYAAQQMVKQGRGGRIIGASSMYGKAGAPSLAGYSASKFGIRGLTHAAALEWGKYGITVNAYAPASIRTPMLEDYDARLTSSKEGMKKGDFLQQLPSRGAIPYLAGPEEIASLVAYLASPEAHFITGQTISVNGGALVD